MSNKRDGCNPYRIWGRGEIGRIAVEAGSGRIAVIKRCTESNWFWETIGTFDLPTRQWRVNPGFDGVLAAASTSRQEIAATLPTNGAIASRISDRPEVPGMDKSWDMRIDRFPHPFMEWWK